MMRADGRAHNEIREVVLEPHFVKHPEGSVLISMGDTKVICMASIEDRVPPFMRGKGKGWITAEYAMLPRATEQRNIRESSRGKVSGRTMEIQRLIGRALRAIIDLDKIGERTVWVDCDVIQADGGTRTAAITGAFIALTFAMDKAMREEKIKEWPIHNFLAAVSVGVDTKRGEILDLSYPEDAAAEVDMNVVMTGNYQFVELQGTGEEGTFSREQLNNILDLAEEGIEALVSKQKKVLGEEITARIVEAKEKEIAPKGDS